MTQDVVTFKSDQAVTYTLAQGGNLNYTPRFFEKARADQMFHELLTAIDWEENPGRPRLVKWVGDFGYEYSGITHPPLAWPPLLKAIREQVEIQVFGESRGQFQGVLLNHYRDGNDGVGFHADNERTIKRDSPIASLSFGAERRFAAASGQASSQGTNGSSPPRTRQPARHGRHLPALLEALHPEAARRHPGPDQPHVPGIQPVTDLKTKATSFGSRLFIL
jgi:hypothetical protein